jgi:hypothetical protein
VAASHPLPERIEDRVAPLSNIGTGYRLHGGPLDSNRPQNFTVVGWSNEQREVAMYATNRRDR